MRSVFFTAVGLIFLATQLHAADESGFGYKFVSPGVFRGARPSTEEKISWLAGQGIRNIINLQGTGASFQPGEKPEEIAKSEEIAKQIGIGYFKKPFSSGNKYSLSQEERASILAAVVLLQNPLLHPIYVHCFFGVDRTGIVIAAFRILAHGCTYEQARDEMYREGAPWTKYVTEGQLPFLQELTLIDQSKRQQCPLPVGEQNGL